MNLKLKKTIAFFDIEATGLNISQDKIVEIAILKINPDQSESSYVKRINPGIEIPEEIVAIHGISNEDVKDAPLFKEVAQEIADFFGDADLAGYNSNKFDIPMLLEHFLSHNIKFSMQNRNFVDVQTIFHKMEQRTLSAALQFYCNEDLNNAHTAEADTRATYNVLKAQIERYDEVENDISFLTEFTQTGKNKKIDFVGRLAQNETGEIVYNFGKHMGKTIKEVYKIEPSYHRWILDNDFPLYTKQILKEHTDILIAEDRNNKAKLKHKEAENLSSKIDQLKNKFNQ